MRGGAGLFTPWTRPQPLQEDVGRDLEDHVGDEEDRETGVVLEAGEFEFLLQPEDGCIGNVDSVRTISSYLDVIVRKRTYRSRKAMRYRIQRHGKTWRSIFAISLRSVV
jgi:hypothetical protein